MLHGISHGFEGLGLKIMDPLQNRSDVFVKMVEVGDDLDEAQINESISTANYARVYLLFGCRNV
jgi:hypothetical protein